MVLVRPIKDKLTLSCKHQLKEYAQVIVIFIQKSCGCPHACDQAPCYPHSWQQFVDQQDSKKKQRTLPLNISVMCKEHLKSAQKYLQTGCTTYRPDLLFCRMLFDVYFVISKFGLLNVDDFSLINFISLNANLKLSKINLMLLNKNFKMLNM